jgi:general secretion pathway protein L
LLVWLFFEWKVEGVESLNMDRLTRSMRRLYVRGLEQLQSLLPTHWVNWFILGRDQRLTIHLSAESLTLRSPKGDPHEVDLMIPLESEGASRSFLMAQAPSIEEYPVDLLLLDEEVMRARIQVPRAAESNLHAVVGFEIDRLTPFQPDAVYYDCWIHEEHSSPDWITVEVRATPRSVIDDALRLLAPLGWSPERVLSAADHAFGAPSNLFPASRRPQASSADRWIGALLKLSLVALVWILLVLPLWVMHSSLDELKSELAGLLQKTKEVEVLRRETDQLIRDARFLSDKKAQSPVVLESLEALTRMTPDDSWLDSIQISGTHMVIQGHSGSTAKMIEQIEKSTYFENTKFLSPVTKDLSNGLERFQIGSDLASIRGIQKSKPSAQSARTR